MRLSVCFYLSTVSSERLAKKTAEREKLDGDFREYMKTQIPALVFELPYARQCLLLHLSEVQVRESMC